MERKIKAPTKLWVVPTSRGIKIFGTPRQMVVNLQYMSGWGDFKAYTMSSLQEPSVDATPILRTASKLYAFLPGWVSSRERDKDKKAFITVVVELVEVADTMAFEQAWGEMVRFVAKARAKNPWQSLAKELLPSYTLQEEKWEKLITAGPEAFD